MKTNRARLVLLVGCVALAGCQQLSPLEPRAALDTNSANEAQATLESGIARNREVQTQSTDLPKEVPKEVMEQLMPPLPGVAPAADTGEERFDLAVNKVKAADRRIRVRNEYIAGYLCKGWRAGARENET